MERKMKMRKHLYDIKAMVMTLTVSIVLLMPWLATAKDSTPVTVKTFIRAETDIAIKKFFDKVGFNKWFHIRVPTLLDKQDVIRMNRDTIYSTAVLDLK
jgi:hypothetical protein